MEQIACVPGRRVLFPLLHAEYMLHIISLLTGDINSINSPLPMCGFIAQLVEQRTGNAEVMGSNPVEARIFFFQASSFQLLKLENLLRRSFVMVILTSFAHAGNSKRRLKYRLFALYAKLVL